MTTRNGKIARLPLVVREEINRRLENGERGTRVVAWLNGRPEVQAIVSAEFGGRPIREQNLSEWKHGGYREWQMHREVRKVAVALGEASGEKSQDGSSTMPSEILSRWLAARYAVMARRPVDNEKEGWQRLRELCADVATLRRGDHRAARLTMERERHKATKSKSTGAEMPTETTSARGNPEGIIVREIDPEPAFGAAIPIEKIELIAPRGFASEAVGQERRPEIVSRPGSRNRPRPSSSSSSKPRMTDRGRGGRARTMGRLLWAGAARHGSPTPPAGVSPKNNTGRVVKRGPWRMGMVSEKRADAGSATRSAAESLAPALEDETDDEHQIGHPGLDRAIADAVFADGAGSELHDHVHEQEEPRE